MRSILIVLLLLIGITAFPQRLIRGYSVAFSYGFLSNGDDINIIENGYDDNLENDVLYHAISDSSKATLSSAICIFFGFPFEYGYGRHRFSIFPSVDVTTAEWFLKFDDPDVQPFGLGSLDSLNYKAFIIMPQVGLMYKYNFFINSAHFALGIGVDLKFPVINQITLKDNRKTEYTEAEANYTIEAADNTIFNTAATMKMHIAPRVGFDAYLSRLFVFNIFYYRNLLNSGTNNSMLSGYIGAGVTYLMPFGKEDDTRVLQQYKNK